MGEKGRSKEGKQNFMDFALPLAVYNSLHIIEQIYKEKKGPIYHWKGVLNYMGKICWINGKPYLVSLPMGGEGEYDYNNPWDEMIDFLGEDYNGIFHWREMYSWCQEAVDSFLQYRTVRGYYSARDWYTYNATRQDENVGFRPVLIPLDPGTMKPDSFLLADIPDGTRIALASLYMDGKAIPEPQDPTEIGDIADYIPGTEIAIGDRDSNPRNWFHVIKFKDLLWVDRNILKWVSWEDLATQGFTVGG